MISLITSDPHILAIVSFAKIVLTIAAAGVGFLAAWLWYKASVFSLPDPQASISDALALHVLTGKAVSATSAEYNARAAIWTAISVAVGAIASLL